MSRKEKSDHAVKAFPKVSRYEAEAAADKADIQACLEAYQRADRGKPKNGHVSDLAEDDKS